LSGKGVIACAGCSTTAKNPVYSCSGSAELPDSLKPSFVPATDEGLLKEAIKGPNEGYLCQGKVYQAKEDAKVRIFRAWNSTNPASEKGIWWSFTKPAGRVSEYRKNYEICYQWSPLDVMTECTLKAGTKVVVGTGQSAECSQYLTYPTSAVLQLYISPQFVANSLVDCKASAGTFSWE